MPIEKLTKEEALRAYARMLNTLDANCLEPFLADDFHYASQSVLAEIESKQEYLDYIRVKLEAIAKSGATVYAEMAELKTYPQGPCVVIAQGSRDNLGGTVLAEVADGKIRRLDMCMIPSPTDAVRSGEYPC